MNVSWFFFAKLINCLKSKWRCSTRFEYVSVKLNNTERSWTKNDSSGMHIIQEYSQSSKSQIHWCQIHRISLTHSIDLPFQFLNNLEQATFVESLLFLYNYNFCSNSENYWGNFPRIITGILSQTQANSCTFLFNEMFYFVKYVNRHYS